MAGLPADAPVLDAAQPDPSLALTMEEMFTAIPEGWGVSLPISSPPPWSKMRTCLLWMCASKEVEENGAIPGSVLIPLDDFITSRADWPADMNTPVAIYCGSGHRSTMAMAMMWSYGYTDVVSLKGGIPTWVEAGLPVEGGTAQAGAT